MNSLYVSTITHAVEEGEKILIGSKNDVREVGNIPHSMNLILSNGFIEKSNLNYIFNKLKQIWPQSYDSILFARYIMGETKSYVQTIDGKSISASQIAQQIEENSANPNSAIFSRDISLYNILDVKYISDMEEFEKAYDLYEYLNDEIRAGIGGTKKTMLILILDDSMNKLELSQEIRDFISEENDDYDSTVIYSNKNLNGTKILQAEIYKISANLIALSNSDNLNNPYCDSYKIRSQSIYSSGIKTLSYFEKKIKYDRIAEEMMNVYLDSFCKRYADEFNFTQELPLESIISIGELLKVCGEHIFYIAEDFDVSIFKHIALKDAKSAEKFNKSNLEQLSCRELSLMSSLDVINSLLKCYCNRKINNNVISEVKNRCKDYIENHASAIEFCKVIDSSIESDIIRALHEPIDIDMSLKDYSCKYILKNIVEGLVCDICKKTITELKVQAKNTVLALTRFIEEFRHQHTAGTIESFQRVYINCAKSFSKSETANYCYKKILKIGNNSENFVDCLLEILKCNIAESDGELFSKSFTDIWTKYLSESSSSPYAQIRKDLNGSSQNIVQLPGLIMNPDLICDMYMLYIPGPESDSADRKLYEEIKKASKLFTVEPIFFNTGCNNKIEVLKLYSVESEDLI